MRGALWIAKSALYLKLNKTSKNEKPDFAFFVCRIFLRERGPLQWIGTKLAGLEINMLTIPESSLKLVAPWPKNPIYKTDTKNFGN